MFRLSSLLCFLCLSSLSFGQISVEPIIDSSYGYFQQLYQDRTSEDYFFVLQKGVNSSWKYVVDKRGDELFLGESNTDKYKKSSTEVTDTIGLGEVSDWMKIRDFEFMLFQTRPGQHYFYNTIDSQDPEYLKRRSKFEQDKFRYIMITDYKSLLTEYPDLVISGAFRCAQAGSNPRTFKLTYPEMARAMGIEGAVYVRFVLNTEGHIKNIDILISPDNALDEGALDLIEDLASVEWIPETTEYPLYYIYPVRFSLE